MSLLPNIEDRIAETGITLYDFIGPFAEKNWNKIMQIAKECIEDTRNKTLEWAAENAMTKTDLFYVGDLITDGNLYDNMVTIDKDSILAGKEHKDLKVE